MAKLHLEAAHSARARKLEIKRHGYAVMLGLALITAIALGGAVAVGSVDLISLSLFLGGVSMAVYHALNQSAWINEHIRWASQMRGHRGHYKQRSS